MRDLNPMFESIGGARLEAKVSVAYRGRISETATNVLDRISVTIDQLGDVTHGPCNWIPRGQMLPRKGDLALIIFDDTNEPWIVVWWPVN